MDASKKNLEIREMELEDLPGVYAMGEAVFTADKWPSLYRTWDEYEPVGLFHSDGEFCLVAERKGKLAGFALGSLIDKRNSAWSYGYLTWLAVDPALKRGGIRQEGICGLYRQTDPVGPQGRAEIQDPVQKNRIAVVPAGGGGFFLLP